MYTGLLFWLGFENECFSGVHCIKSHVLQVGIKVVV